jgi:hypothetical protein
MSVISAFGIAQTFID